MYENRFPKSIPAAFLLTGFILLILSVGPQVSAYSEDLNTSDTAFFASGSRSVGSSDLTPAQNIGATFLAYARDALAGQYASPQSVAGARLNEAELAALPAFDYSNSTLFASGLRSLGNSASTPAQNFGAAFLAHGRAALAGQYSSLQNVAGPRLHEILPALNAVEPWTATLSLAYYRR